MTPFPQRRAVAVYLNPGEIVVAEVPARVTTVLGSCVAVTLFSPRTRLGAICHAVLPSGFDRREPGRHVDHAVRYMLDFFQENKVMARGLVAKVFGGADMFPQMQGHNTIGAQNIRAALAALKRADIAPAVVEVSGQQGRKLIFFSDTGEVYVKRVQKEQMRAVEEVLVSPKKSRTTEMPARSGQRLFGTKGDAWSKKSGS